MNQWTPLKEFPNVRQPWVSKVVKAATLIGLTISCFIVAFLISGLAYLLLPEHTPREFSYILGAVLTGILSTPITKKIKRVRQSTKTKAQIDAEIAALEKNRLNWQCPAWRSRRRRRFYLVFAVPFIIWILLVAAANGWFGSFIENLFPKNGAWWTRLLGKE